MIASLQGPTIRIFEYWLLWWASLSFSCSTKTSTCNYCTWPAPTEILEISSSWFKTSPTNTQVAISLDLNISSIRGSISTTVLLQQVAFFGNVHAGGVIATSTFSTFEPLGLKCCTFGGTWDLQFLRVSKNLTWVTKKGEVSHTQHPHKNQNPFFQQGFFHANLKLDQV